MSQNSKIRLVRAYDDGWRMFIAIYGYKFITLINRGTLSISKVKEKDFEGKMFPQDIDCDINYVIGRIYEKSEQFERLGVSHPRQGLLNALDRAKKIL